MRVNVGLTFDEATEQRLIQANRVLNSGVSGEIELGSKTCRPHLTLLMGHVADERLREVINAVSKTSASLLNSVTLKLGDPTTPKGRGHVFVAVTPSSPIISLRRRLRESLGDLIAPERYGDVSNPPHVTIGYVTEASQLSGALAAAEMLEGTSLVASDIQVSEVGNRGTLARALSTISLPGPAA